MPNVKVYFDRIIAMEGNIFVGFLFDWAPMKELFLKEIYEGKKKLETFSLLDVPDDAISKVARTLGV